MSVDTEKETNDSKTSIDDLFSDATEQKVEAITLLSKPAEELTEEQLETVARAIYLTTFKAVLSLEYSTKFIEKIRTDSSTTQTKESWGCVEPDDTLFAEVSSYGIIQNGNFSHIKLHQFCGGFCFAITSFS